MIRSVISVLCLGTAVWLMQSAPARAGSPAHVITGPEAILVVVGPVESVDLATNSAIVAGQMVTATGPLAIGSYVAVYGAVLSNGYVHADFVVPAGDSYVPGANSILITGVVRAVDARIGRVVIGGTTADYTSTLAAGSGHAFATGDLVRVAGTQPDARGIVLASALRVASSDNGDVAHSLGVTTGLFRTDGVTTGLFQTQGVTTGLRATTDGVTTGLKGSTSTNGVTTGLFQTQGVTTGLRATTDGVTTGLRQTTGVTTGLRATTDGVTTGLKAVASTDGVTTGLRVTTDGVTTGLKAVTSTEGVTTGLRQTTGVTTGLKGGTSTDGVTTGLRVTTDGVTTGL